MTAPFRPTLTTAFGLALFGIFSGTAHADDLSDRVDILAAGQTTLQQNVKTLQTAANRHSNILTTLSNEVADQQNDLLLLNQSVQNHTATLERQQLAISDNTMAIASSLGRAQAAQSLAQRNNEAIATNKAKLDQIERSLSSNGMPPATLAQIEKNSQAIERQSQRIENQKQGIDANQKALQAQDKRLDAAEHTLGQQAGTLKDHENRLDAQQAQSERNQQALAGHEADIARNRSSIAENRALIEQNLGRHSQRSTAAEAQIARNSAGLQQLAADVRGLRQDTERGFAAQAALSGLFQPYGVGKFNLTAAVGGYRKQSAVAVGAGYRFNEQFATKAGIAFNPRGGHAVYHLGVNLEW